MSRSSVCALLVLALALAAPARAQTTPIIAPDRPLTLEDAIGLAVQRNFNLQIQGNSLERSKLNVEIARAVFDPTITGRFDKSYSISPNRTSLLDGTARDSTSYSAGVSQLLPWTNGTLSLATTGLTRSASNNVNDVFNPSYGFGLNLSYSQSVRSFGSQAAHTGQMIAKIGLSIATITYRDRVLSLIASVESAYLNLVTARETVRIRQASLALAQRVFDENSTRRTTGLMTDIDVLTAEVSVANAQRALILSEDSVRTAEENLLNLINVPDFDTRPGPVKFEDYTEGVPNLAQSYKTARERYPALLTGGETLKQLQLSLNTARRNLRPNLNFNTTAGYSGRTGNEGFWHVAENIVDDHGRNWSFGVTYNLPWGRRVDKAQFRQAQIEIASQKLSIEQTEQQLSVLVRQAVRAIETNISAVELATKQTQLAERQYEQQKARFDSGLTTSRQVQQFQDDLEDSRFQELSAKLNLRRAVTTLRQLDGTSIDRYRIQLPQ